MSLFGSLLLLPLAPLRGTLWVARQIQEQAEAQYSGQGAIVSQLEAIEQAREAGQIDEEEAARLEQELIDRQIAAAAGQ